MKKKNKFNFPTLQARGKSFEVPQNVVKENERKQQEYFRWTIAYDEYIPQSSCKREPFVRFLEHTIQELNKYEKCLWNQVLREKNNHVVYKEQKLEAEQQIKHKLQVIKKDVEIYQLKGHTLSHRIFGYRENGVFHVMLNDLHHKQSK